MRSRTLASVVAGAGTALVLMACGIGTTGSAAPAGGATSAATTASGTAAAGAVTRVSANTASEGEIAAALESAGVGNADRWAREVVEYRPYDTSDAELVKLQQNLAKYNPGSETLAKILSALTP
jgi:hypothetical protein